MSEQEKARDVARLLTAWAEKKTLQYTGKPGEWIDYASEKLPVIPVPSLWRIKPEPRTVWLADSSVSGLAHVARTPEKAEELRQNLFTVTEWKEALP
jgi:hypothetical protein